MTSMEATLCDIRIPPSLDDLVKTFSARGYKGAEVELWVLDGQERRAKAQEILENRGVKAHIRSAYKPLVHAFVEEIDLEDITHILVRYPTVKGVAENRFLLESYPVADLVGPRPLVFEKAEINDEPGILLYGVELTARDGAKRTVEVAAPNVIRPDHTGKSVLTSTGWVRARASANPGLDRDGPYETDQEKAFAAAIAGLKDHPWPGDGPYFDRMNLRIEAPFYDRRLPLENECLSTAEAMHEDLYFSALDVFKTRHGLGTDDRTFMPGQIVPEIVTTDGPVRVCVATGTDPYLDADKTVVASRETDLETAGHWLEPGVVKAHLDALGGEPYEARSRRGRPVWGAYVEGPGPTVVITAGQHSNETSGTIGALRAAKRLKQAGETGFAISPLDNPDGYALFRELCATHPYHMHHASRYTAAGGDLGHIGRAFENEVRYLGREKTGADLHINLHGYPAHEWTRPFTGYIPRDFELWTIPKGFFLILRYKPGWKERGEAILDAIIEELAGFEPVVSLNREQLARYRHYVPDPSFKVHEDIPVFVSEVTEGLFPITIITEAPDETIYGGDFVIAHTAQMKAVLAATAAHRQSVPT